MMLQNYITLKEFCDLTKISTSTAYRMIRNGTLLLSSWPEPETGKSPANLCRIMIQKECKCFQIFRITKGEPSQLRFAFSQKFYNYGSFRIPHYQYYQFYRFSSSNQISSTKPYFSARFKSLSFVSYSFCVSSCHK